MRLGLAGGVVLAAMLAASSVATAQGISGFADDRFEPAAAGSDWLTAESLDFRGHLRVAAALVDDWARNPILAYDAQGNATTALVSDQLFAHFDVAMVLWDRVRVDLNVPVAVVDSGSNAQVAGQTYEGPETRVLGDLRLGADAVVVGKAHGQFVAAVGFQLFLPTGAPRAFSGDGGVRFWPRVMAAGERGRFVWASRLGIQVRPRDSCGCNLAPGTEANGVLAAGWRLVPRIMIGPELFGSAALSGGTLADRGTPAIELLVGGHWAVAPRWDVSLGISRGLSNGPGAPAFRAIVGVGFAIPSSSEPPRAPETVAPVAAAVSP